ncbi:N-acetylmuramidase family protein [Mucilaginibacter phyllosphaerae]|uniref:N-acetylmuramidase family protein n=1 Tax=Mucilaginibacter phyllosphaerae TaxID=1812349 RepID=A0A4Y8ALE3_9SPHI|nr:N-acetylmuramidase family protein [Mucilaginibacter phyllosphaerae]MBB3967718.1 hypothetical protein [Mucilaginibacter phyllosphaerae]TEW69229.1 N-acetylmuramidase family protein [Mucilaginibacter phyllosphaerae]GGH03789.1 hypothetical protein GCM10007352_06610 [Mucilaginibacter phyllosphaerae]
MNKTLTEAQIFELATSHGYNYKALKAIIQIESGQHGFSPVTGKLIIQFEPAWFKRLKKDWQNDTKHVIWQSNTVGDQTAEWKAFNNAFASDADAAMKSTSIGMMQLMGFHYAALGFNTVGQMWDFAKADEYNQVLLAIKWIKTVPALDKALKAKNWQKVAYYYNGENYRQYRYDSRLAAAYNTMDEFKKVNI